MRRLVLLLALAAVTAGCLVTAIDASGARRGTKVQLHGTDLGRILVDHRGRTLYLFEKDGRRSSACTGACAADWPPVTTKGRPVGRGRVRGRHLSSFVRRDGRRQVTYYGHPLYRFAGDAGPGDHAGEGVEAFGARWYAVSRRGRAVVPKVENVPPTY